MKERPVLFSAPMVKAILEGKKTMTRRLVKPQPEVIPEDSLHGRAPGSFWWPSTLGQTMVDLTEMHFLGPYGWRKDSLWVKETWAADPSWNGTAPRDMDPHSVAYRASDDTGCWGKWRPSIFMPRWASRITLDITDVRVERLQAITAADILAEGAVERSHDSSNLGLGKCPVSRFDGKVYMDLKSLWQSAWDSINGKTAPYKANPFVWVVCFKVLS